MIWKRKNRFALLLCIIALGTLLIACGYERVDSYDNIRWYEKYHIIAHSGGGIGGYTYANCIEGWQSAYERGVRIYDADINMTSDGVLVLRHDWSDNLETSDVSMSESEISIDVNGIHHKIDERIPTYAEFIDTKVYSKYTPMDLNSVISFMLEHEDVFVSIDTKTPESLRKLVDYFCETNHEELLKRVITNTYTFEGYFEIMDVYPFENVVMRQYYWCMNDWQEVAEFCTEHNIHVVNVSANLHDDVGIHILKDAGLYVYYAVVDYISDMKIMQESGGNGIISNWLGEEDWNYANKIEGNH